MNAPLQKPLTLETFLAWEGGQPLRYEFDGFRTIAKTGGTAGHALIQINLAIAVGGRLRGTPCRFVGSDLKIQVGDRIRYPDGFVYCGPFQADRRVIDDPVVIFEVLNESTSSTDLITKNAEYAATPSVRRNIVLAQDAIAGPCLSGWAPTGSAACCRPRVSCACRKSASRFPWLNSTKAWTSRQRTLGKSGWHREAAIVSRRCSAGGNHLDYFGAAGGGDTALSPRHLI
jgi:Uma2 family endonuclease